MRAKFVLSIISISLLVQICTSYSACFFDHWNETLLQNSDPTLSDCDSTVNLPVRDRSQNCIDLILERSFKLFQSESNPETFNLSTKLYGEKTVLSVVINNIRFDKLTIRLNSQNQLYCQRIQWDLSATKRPEKLSFLSLVEESVDTNLQLLAEWRNGNFFKEYNFLVPTRSRLDYSKSVKDHRLFAYVDTTHSDGVRLYVQPLPERFNVTIYQGWFQQANTVLEAFNLSKENMQHKQSYYSADGENYYFAVKPMHLDCRATVDEPEPCVTVTPSFYMRSTRTSLIITIVSSIWVPFVIFFALYKVCTLYRYRRLPRMSTNMPTCWLVYSAIQDYHIDVMIKLTEYLRACHINVMIDVLDIPEETNKNPGHWCDMAFQKADCIIMAASPSYGDGKAVTKSAYGRLDYYAMRLINENYHRKNKTYLTLLFPYSDEDSVPPVAKPFRLFKIPQELDKLVNIVHGANYAKLFNTPNQELINSIEWATNNSNTF